MLFDAGQPWQSAVTQFNLVCSDEWFDSLSTALGLLGLMIGAYITVFYVDRHGRKHAIMVWNFITAICLLVHAFMPNKYGFLAMRVLGVGFGHVSSLAEKAYTMELLGPRKRAISGMLCNIYYSVGYIGAGLLSYCFPDWRTYTLAFAALGKVLAPILFHSFIQLSRHF